MLSKPRLDFCATDCDSQFGRDLSSSLVHHVPQEHKYVFYFKVNLLKTSGWMLLISVCNFRFNNVKLSRCHSNMSVKCAVILVIFISHSVPFLRIAVLIAGSRLLAYLMENKQGQLQLSRLFSRIHCAVHLLFIAKMNNSSFYLFFYIY